jgi:energy-coupling factor transporter ATP-binding protein EcfA2
VKVVLGRKGSGKSALFWQVRDRLKEERRRIVVDLKPDGYKLLKFKEDVLSLLQEGTLEHTIMAFWEYLILLEVAYKMLEKDREVSPQRSSDIRALSGASQSIRY